MRRDARVPRTLRFSGGRWLFMPASSEPERNGIVAVPARGLAEVRGLFVTY